MINLMVASMKNFYINNPRFLPVTLVWLFLSILVGIVFIVTTTERSFGEISKSKYEYITTWIVEMPEMSQKVEELLSNDNKISNAEYGIIHDYKRDVMKQRLSNTLTKINND